MRSILTGWFSYKFAYKYIIIIVMKASTHNRTVLYLFMWISSLVVRCKTNAPSILFHRISFFRNRREPILSKSIQTMWSLDSPWKVRLTWYWKKRKLVSARHQHAFHSTRKQGRRTNLATEIFSSTNQDQTSHLTINLSSITLTFKKIPARPMNKETNW